MAEHHEGETSQNARLPVRRRAGHLILITVLSGGISFTAAAALGWLLGASVATAAGYAIALRAVLAASGTTLLVLRKWRTTRRATALTPVAVAGVLFCAVPAGTFATLAVGYNPTGQANPGAAVNAYAVVNDG